MLFEDEGRVLDQILEAAEKDGAAAVVDEILDLRSIEAQGKSASETLATAGLPVPNTCLPHLKSAPRRRCSRARGRALWKMSAALGAAHGGCVSSHGFHF